MNIKSIKDAARQAFRDQQLQDTEGGVPDAVSFCAGFLAGARYRQSEIDELQNKYETLDAHDEMLIATVDKLKIDNEKLQGALEFYADLNDEVTMYDSRGVSLARQVLGELK